MVQRDFQNGSNRVGPVLSYGRGTWETGTDSHLRRNAQCVNRGAMNRQCMFELRLRKFNPELFANSSFYRFYNSVVVITALELDTQLSSRTLELPTRLGSALLTSETSRIRL